MKLALFCHSLVSDWNHGNAHFLRGVVHELLLRGHAVSVWEPADAWSRRRLLAERGTSALADFRRAFPSLRSATYEPRTLDLAAVLERNDVVLLHEWNDPAFVDRLARARRARPDGALVLWHDTHHRAVSDPGALERLAPQRFDAALVFGASLARVYEARGLARRVHVWHEAADVRLFHPLPSRLDGDLVWVGNWGDGERASELEELLIEPVRRLGLRATVHGVRYPDAVLRRLERAGIRYGGWLANHEVPTVFARYRATIHVPRRPYREELVGVPTIRVFEALACGLPLVCTGFRDTEHLFRPGQDYLVARDGEEATEQLRRLLEQPNLARRVASSGLASIRARHTCAHRVDELLRFVDELGATRGSEPAASRRP